MMLFKRRDGMLVKKLDDEHFVLNREKGMILSFNETGNFLYNLLDTARSRDELIAALNEKFKVSTEDARSDVDEFLARLRQNDIIVEVDG